MCYAFRNINLIVNPNFKMIPC